MSADKAETTNDAAVLMVLMSSLIEKTENLTAAIEALKVKESRTNVNVSFLDTRDLGWLRGLAQQARIAITECSAALAGLKAKP